jgi:ribosomal protein S12 methylthiotransferase accessory factor
MSSSFRAEPLRVTLANAKALARQLGISRVTDITRLDWVGVPVFASIRPDAQPGSLCVNAGKGTRVNEARVGAYMEAIEYAFAEYNRASLKVSLTAAGNIYLGRKRPQSILDFCPVMNAEINLDGPVACVRATEISSGKTFQVPAELVFLPFPIQLGGARYFGCNSNGLASGNSVLEATVHGLIEVIERDISSFQAIKDDSVLVLNQSLPPPIRIMESRLSAGGMKLYVRQVKNGFDIPFFMAVVAEADSHDPIYISVGYGCHPCKEIAVTRAVCEALQSRLSFIHGGRDDLAERYQRFRGRTRKTRMRYARNLLSRICEHDSSIDFEEIPDLSAVATDLQSSLDVVVSILRRNAFEHILRVVYTPPKLPLQVVRILVPGLECFTETTARIGVRLRDYVRAQA